MSPSALQRAQEGLAAALPGLSVEPLVGTYDEAFPQLRRLEGPRLVIFLGSSIGNFDPPEATALLARLRQNLASGDSLLLGMDLAKAPDLLVPAYDDAHGVTARFNLNMLARLNRELGARFDLDAFRHRACWNAAASRMEMHLDSLRAQEVWIEALGRSVPFEAGESIHTENSYKFTQGMAGDILGGAGFDGFQTWKDPQGWFSLHLARIT